MIRTYYRGENFLGTEQDRLHFHADFEMLFVTGGRMEMQVSGQTVVAETASVVFLGNLEAHRVVSASEDYARYVLTAAPDSLRGVSPVLLSVFRSRPEGFSHVLDVRECADELQPLFDALVSESMAPDTHSVMCSESLVRLLLARLYRFCPGAFPAARTEYPEGIVQAQRWLDEHFRESFSIDDVAQRFFMSPSTFRHLFRTLIGLSPKQYVMLSRLAYARELLGTTALPVAEIAEQSGFSDVSNFIRRFRQHYGVTPHSLRRE